MPSVLIAKENVGLKNFLPLPCGAVKRRQANDICNEALEKIGHEPIDVIVPEESNESLIGKNQEYPIGTRVITGCGRVFRFVGNHRWVPEYQFIANPPQEYIFRLMNGV